MMTRKDYEETARRFRANLIAKPAAGFDEGYVAGVEEMAHEMASIFAADNPRFDRARFLTACGLSV